MPSIGRVHSNRFGDGWPLHNDPDYSNRLPKTLHSQIVPFTNSCRTHDIPIGTQEVGNGFGCLLLAHFKGWSCRA